MAEDASPAIMKHIGEHFRINYLGDSLATLYDPDKMPDDLIAAHKALDAAVEAAYSVEFNGDEEKMAAHLFKLYAEMAEGGK